MALPRLNSMQQPCHVLTGYFGSFSVQTRTIEVQLTRRRTMWAHRAQGAGRNTIHSQLRLGHRGDTHTLTRRLAVEAAPQAVTAALLVDGLKLQLVRP